MAMPTLTTGRLVLRPFTLEDAPAVRRLANHHEIALNTLAIPHPYPEGEAERWIGTHQEAFDKRGDVSFAITLIDSLIGGGELVGAIGLIIAREHDRAEIGYWIGVEHWGRGYASEAAEAVLRHAFEVADVNRVFAAHFSRNPASGSVLRKIGMRHEGTARQNYKKWGEYLDSEMYAIVRDEWPAR
jgi:ribosomal-protein-alanine N-acetyltransferase